MSDFFNLFQSFNFANTVWLLNWGWIVNSLLVIDPRYDLFLDFPSGLVRSCQFCLWTLILANYPMNLYNWPNFPLNFSLFDHPLNFYNWSISSWGWILEFFIQFCIHLGHMHDTWQLFESKVILSLMWTTHFFFLLLLFW